MSKQDRQGVRTPADLERKYNFGKTFAEVMGFANDAKEAAEDAEGAVEKLDKSLDQEEIFNRLTNYGVAEGLFRDPETGQLYINASYLATGVIRSADGTVEVDLGNNCITLHVDETEDHPAGEIRLSANGIVGFGANSDPNGTMLPTLTLNPGGDVSEGVQRPTTFRSGFSSVWVASDLDDGQTRLGSAYAHTVIDGKTIYINGKMVSWKDNGDGTYTLIGQ